MKNNDLISWVLFDQEEAWDSSMAATRAFLGLDGGC